jgi:ATP-dependent helicase/nuclease subunit B
MHIDKISESKYKTFKQCKLKYRYKYVDYLPEPDEANTDALHFGSYIHKIFEDGVNIQSEKELVKLSEELRGEYKVSTDYTGKDLICIKNFLEFNKKLGETVSTELSFEVELGKDIKLNGIIDRIIKGKNNTYLIIDYKTSKKEKSKIELYQDTQLKGYTYAVHKMFNVPIKNITVAHYYPLTDNLVNVSYTSNQINSYVKSIIDEVWRIRKAKKESLVATRNEFCNWCPYKSLCPEFNDPLVIEENLKKIKTS